MASGFAIQRGVNISRWLPQPRWRGVWERHRLAVDDLKRIHGWGFDHVRLAMHEHELFDQEGQRRRGAFAALAGTVEAALKLGLRVVADLHRLRAQHRSHTVDHPQSADPALTRRFTEIWRELSSLLRSYPAEGLAYDLLNEIRMSAPQAWHDLLGAGLATVREREPARTVVAGPNGNRSLREWGSFEAPHDPHMLLAFHFYRPLLLTHYGIDKSTACGYRGPIRYPGAPIAPEDMEGVPAALREGRVTAWDWNRAVDRSYMAAQVALAMGLGRQRGLPVYCAEFGCSRYAPADLRDRWLRDWLGVLRSNGVPYCIWAYRGDFGLLDDDGEPRPILESLRQFEFAG